MNAPRLTVSQQTTPTGTRVLSPAGEIDHHSADTLHQALAASRTPAPRTVLDFREVTFMNSTGINILISAHQNTQAHGGQLRLAHVPPPVMDVLRIVGLDEILPLYPTLDLALTS